MAEQISLNLDEIYNIARSGDGYLAIERLSPIVRKMKKNDQLTEAMALMIDFATFLAEIKQYESATNCAKKAIEMFPITASKIKVYLKKKFLDFILNATPEYNNSDFYSYAANVIRIIGDQDNKIRLKELEIAQSGNNYPEIEFLLIKLICIELESDATDKSQITFYLNSLADQLWNWIQNLDLPNTHDKEQQRLFNAQYIFAHSIFAFLSCNNLGIKVADEFLQIIENHIPSTINPTFLKFPMMNFSRFYIKALLNKSLTTVNYLEEKYRNYLKKDQDIEEFLSKVHFVHFPSPQSGFDNLIENMVGLFNNF